MRRHPAGRIRAALLLPLLTAAAVLVGCGGEESTTAGPSTEPGAGASASPGGSAAPGAACPSESTRSFAKTRFVADVGGAAFLTKRYIYNPYTEGQFTQGAQGRTTAVVKAGLAAAASVKLLNNAKENAQADPTLCRTIAAPMTKAIAALSGVTAALAAGDLSVLGSLGATLDSLRGVAGQNGIQVPEREVGINGS